MLINHTSGLAEYLPYAYPSLKAFPILADTRSESHHRSGIAQPTQFSGRFRISDRAFSIFVQSAATLASGWKIAGRS
jgi:hypothetical protein